MTRPIYRPRASFAPETGGPDTVEIGRTSDEEKTLQLDHSLPYGQKNRRPGSIKIKQLRSSITSRIATNFVRHDHPVVVASTQDDDRVLPKAFEYLPEQKAEELITVDATLNLDQAIELSEQNKKLLVVVKGTQWSLLSDDHSLPWFDELYTRKNVLTIAMGAKNQRIDRYSLHIEYLRQYCFEYSQERHASVTVKNPDQIGSFTEPS